MPVLSEGDRTKRPIRKPIPRSARRQQQQASACKPGQACTSWASPRESRWAMMASGRPTPGTNPPSRRASPAPSTCRFPRPRAHPPTCVIWWSSLTGSKRRRRAPHGFPWGMTATCRGASRGTSPGLPRPAARWGSWPLELGVGTIRHGGDNQKGFVHAQRRAFGVAEKLTEAKRLYP